MSRADGSGEAAFARLSGVGMVTVRADLASAPLGHALNALGCEVPAQRWIAFGRKCSAAWMSPDELLLIGASQDAPAFVSALSEALSGEHHLVADVSDARASFRVSGPAAREVIAKGAPIDLSPAAFGPGDFRRTRLGQVACAFWMMEDGGFELICFRSVADFVETWLENAAAGPFPGVLTS